MILYVPDMLLGWEPRKYHDYEAELIKKEAINLNLEFLDFSLKNEFTYVYITIDNICVHIDVSKDGFGMRYTLMLIELEKDDVEFRYYLYDKIKRSFNSGKTKEDNNLRISTSQQVYIYHY